MATLFVKTLKTLYYEHMMGSSTQQFSNVMAIAKRIKQGIKSSRISTFTEKKGFGGKKKDVHHIEASYKGKKNSFHNYSTQTLTFQIANINLNLPFPVKKPETQNNQAKN
jgi:hypothetical protein